MAPFKAWRGLKLLACPSLSASAAGLMPLAGPTRGGRVKHPSHPLRGVAWKRASARTRRAVPAAPCLHASRLRPAASAHVGFRPDMASLTRRDYLGVREEGGGVGGFQCSFQVYTRPLRPQRTMSMNSLWINLPKRAPPSGLSRQLALYEVLSGK